MHEEGKERKKEKGGKRKKGTKSNWKEWRGKNAGELVWASCYHKSIPKLNLATSLPQGCNQWGKEANISNSLII